MIATRLICAGCGWQAEAFDPAPFACPHRGDGGEHVLVRHVDPWTPGLDEAFLGPGSAVDGDAAPSVQPFVRYRRFLHAWHVATARGLSDADFVARVEDLDRRVADVEGFGLVETPFAPALDAELWVKDETGQVSGSHKARHLFGLGLWLEIAEAVGLGEERRSLGIASCGNAALAAAVVARAMDRELSVFVPEDAPASTVARLEELGARLHVCERRGGEAGDPCYLRFSEQREQGLLPFGCQGPDNGLTVEGGMTLGYEMAGALFRAGLPLDHLVVQVGGGALASAVFAAFAEAQTLGVVGRLPRMHTVQTQSVHPLRRAWEMLVERVYERVNQDPGDDEDVARALAGALDPQVVDEELARAAARRDEYMTAWPGTPHSVATGILDDETYDWLALLRAMVRSGGIPLVVGEGELRRAHETAVAGTGLPVCFTGSAGLAGWEKLGAAPGERSAVIFTGRRRAGELL